MNNLAASLAKLMIGFLSLFGPIALILWVLNARDQRESKLFATVLGELNRPHFRGLFTVKVKSWPLRADTVVVDFWNCSQEQVWNVIESLSTKLPTHVQLEVNGITDCRQRSTWKLKVMRSRLVASCYPV